MYMGFPKFDTEIQEDDDPRKEIMDDAVPDDLEETLLDEEAHRLLTMDADVDEEILDLFEESHTGQSKENDFM